MLVGLITKYEISFSKSISNLPCLYYAPSLPAVSRHGVSNRHEFLCLTRHFDTARVGKLVVVTRSGTCPSSSSCSSKSIHVHVHLWALSLLLSLSLSVILQSISEYGCSFLYLLLFRDCLATFLYYYLLLFSLNYVFIAFCAFKNLFYWSFFFEKNNLKLIILALDFGMSVSIQLLSLESSSDNCLAHQNENCWETWP